MKTMTMIALAACAAILCGCQTRITAEKNPEQVLPIQEKVTVNGEERVITTHYQIASGGWYATARSPLWATEELRGLSIGVHTNGSVTLGLDAYHRDLSTNAVTMAHNLVVDFAELAEKAAAAYATCGASLAAGKVAAISAKGKASLQKAMASYILKGGKSGNATVTCENGNCTFSDGTVTETCVNCFE